MSTPNDPQLKDMFSLFPVEIWKYIFFSFLSPWECSNLIFVSQSWKQVITDSMMNFIISDPKHLQKIFYLYPNLKHIKIAKYECDLISLESHFDALTMLENLYELAIENYEQKNDVSQAFGFFFFNETDESFDVFMQLYDGSEDGLFV